MQVEVPFSIKISIAEERLNINDIAITMSLKRIVISIEKTFKFQNALASTDCPFDGCSSVICLGKAGQMLRKVPVDLGSIEPVNS